VSVEKKNEALKTLTLPRRTIAKGVSQNPRPSNSCVLKAWLNQLSLLFFKHEIMSYFAKFLIF